MVSFTQAGGCPYTSKSARPYSKRQGKADCPMFGKLAECPYGSKVKDCPYFSKMKNCPPLGKGCPFFARVT